MHQLVISRRTMSILPLDKQCSSSFLISPTVFSGVSVTRSLVFSVVFCRSLLILLSFFIFTIVVSVLLRPTVFDYPFDAFNLYVYEFFFCVEFVFFMAVVNQGGLSFLIEIILLGIVSLAMSVIVCLILHVMESIS